MERNPWFRALVVLAVIALLIHLGSQLWQTAQHFADIIVVFFLAWLLAYMLNPVATFFEIRYRIPRSIGAATVYLGMFVAVGVAVVLILPLVIEQLIQLGQLMPGYVATGQGWIAWAQAELANRGVPIDLTSVYKTSDLPGQVANLGSGIVTNTINVVSGIASALFNITLVLILSFYLVSDGERIQKRIAGLVPSGYQDELSFFLDSIDRTFGGWLRGTVLISLVYGLGNAVVMAGAGLSYVLLASLIAAIVMIIPFFGPALAMIMPVLLAALQGDVTKLVVVIVGLLVLQTLVFNVLSPKVMGESIGMHPLLVFLALLVGIKQAGLVGAIFGVPVIGVFYAMGMYFIEKRPAARAAEILAGVPSEGVDGDQPIPSRKLSPSRSLTDRLFGIARVRLGGGRKSGGRVRSRD